MQFKLLAALSPLLLSACIRGTPAEILPIPSPDDPDSGVRAISPADYLDGYSGREPVEPQPWRRQNESAAPGGSQ